MVCKEAFCATVRYRYNGFKTNNRLLILKNPNFVDTQRDLSRNCDVAYTDVYASPHAQREVDTGFRNLSYRELENLHRPIIAITFGLRPSKMS